MLQEELFPRVQSHGHYPFDLIKIATKVPAGKSKKVFENWDEYVETCKFNRHLPSIKGFCHNFYYSYPI